LLEQVYSQVVTETTKGQRVHLASRTRPQGAH